jgi:hypothetical protein
MGHHQDGVQPVVRLHRGREERATEQHQRRRLEAIAQQRFREMLGLKNISFKFAHCYTFLEHNSKWKLREQEVPPPKHKLIELKDAEEDDVLYPCI